MSKGKKTEIWAELLNLTFIKPKLEQIYLDPNNPRLETPDKEKVNDARIPEKSIQEDCLKKIRDLGITDLTESIKTSSFWTVDRIVLRSIGSDRYVVIEGNRRVAALKTLKESHDNGKITLATEIYKGTVEFEALLYKGKNRDIAWIIQGFRHTPGIKSWERYPKAKFFSAFEKERKKTPKEIASIFGIKPTKEVAHLIRSYCAFQQAKSDKDYGDVLESDKFGHFDEIILKKDELKDWLEWNDTRRKFINTNNLNKYLSWAIPEEGMKPKIDISPTTREVLPKLIQPNNKRLLEKFEKGQLDIEQCARELDKEEGEREPIDVTDTIKMFEGMKKIINTLPVPQLQMAKTKEEKKQKKDLCELLKELAEIITRQIKNLK
jgi:hypothetical protein